MKRIDFKAWDTKRKMFTNFIIADNRFKFMDKVAGVWFRDDEQERFKLLQNTGLKDKNGKEIFEGDIVIAWSQGVKGIFEIKRRVDGLWFLYPAWKYEQFWYLRPTEDGCESCEVIGNIYENPELLEVEE